MSIVSSVTSGLIKVTKKGAKAPAKAAPFYSAVDEVAQGLSRNKGTGKEFLREIEKTKGVKPAEIKDRKLDKILNTDQKMTKDDLVKVLEDNPPKQITEDIMGEPTQKMIDQKIEDMIEKEVIQELGPRPKYGHERMDWLDDYDRLIEQKSYRSNDYYDEAKEAIKQEGNWGSSKYDRSDWKLAGGENYREILLKLPPTKSANQQRIMELEAYERRGATDKKLLDELAQLRASRDAAPDEFQSKHWDQPNVLAHIRVQDRVGPNGEKVLHVEEIQSDWHQTGRKKGYRKPDQPERLKGEPYQLDDGTYGVRWEDGSVSDLGWGKDHAERLAAQGKLTEGVPDAPFKNTWHELAMKRLINYASENGYDKIAITPGAEQAKRYDLSKQIDQIKYAKNQDGTYDLYVRPKGERQNTAFIGDKSLIGIGEAEIEGLVGKEIAQKIALGEGPQGGDNFRSLTGFDLQVGGEGMKGFYDQMLPAYLNKYGEKYGAKVGQLPISHGEKMIPDNAGLGMIRSGEPELTQLHSFDITPQMREEVLTKGQPLYQQIGIPAATGAAGAEMLGAEMPEEPGFAEGGAVNENTVPDMSDGGNILQGPPFKRGGKVSVTDNPDAMFLELNDQHFGVGGAAKKAIKALKGTQKVLPAAEREASLQKFLEPSAEKRRMYHGSKEPNIKEFKTRKDMTDESMMTGHYADERDAVFLSPEPQFTTHFSKEGYTDTHQAPTTYPVYVQVEKPFDFDNPEHLQRVKETYLDMYHNPESDLYDPHMLPSERSMAQHTFNKRIDALPVDENNWPRIENAEFQEILKDIGFDSFYTRERGTKNLGVYDPNRIKSAIGNRGTYDTTQPDINEAQGGLATLKRK